MDELTLVRTIMDGLPVGVWVARAPTGEFVYANARFAEIMGIVARDDIAIGEYAQPYGIHNPAGEPYPEDQMPFVRALAERTTVTADDLVIHRHDGIEVPLRVWARPIFDAAGEIEMVVVAFSDITREVALESARAQSDERLAEVQRMESIGTLAGGIAHDFNNLLASIQMLSSMLALDETDTQRQLDLQSILEATSSAERLTSALLGFAKRRRHRVEPVSVHQVIERVCGLLSRTLDRQVVLRLELAATNDVVHGDASQLEQVLMNFVLNARDAMPDGGTVTLATRNPSPDQLIVESRDTGPGIAPAIRGRIFDPYFTTKGDARSGAGLGLAMAYGIVAAHSGSLELVDTPIGATLRMTLPTQSGTPDLMAGAWAGTLRQGLGRILVVDDDSTVRTTCTSALRVLGYQSEDVGSGAEAIALVRAQPGQFDAVLLDMTMPGMTGRETFIALRELEPDLRVLLMSGFALNDEARGLLKLGVRGFLAKPFGLPRLSEAMAAVLAEP